MAKGYSLGVRLDIEVRAALEKAAKADNRTVSSLVQHIIIEWLKAKKYL